MTCGFMGLARLQNRITIGITIFKIFIRGGISSDIRSDNFEYSYPLIGRVHSKYLGSRWSFPFDFKILVKRSVNNKWRP